MLWVNQGDAPNAEPSSHHSRLPKMLATGVDLIEVDRIEEAVQRFGARFLDRVFTVAEQRDCADRPTSLAARWAAKEAASKALGIGIGDVRWVEMEVVRGVRGEPVLRFHGDAATLVAARGWRTWSLSLSHTAELAIAFVVAQGE